MRFETSCQRYPLILKNLIARLLNRPAQSARAGTQSNADTLQEGFRLQTAGNPADAEVLYRRVLDAEPDSADANYLLGALLGKRERYEEAEACLRKALAMQPDFADAQMAMGNVLLLRSDIAGARDCYANAIRIAPGDATAYSNLGLACQAANDHDGALAAFARAFELAPRLPDVVRNLTIERLHLDLHEQSEVHLRELLSERPDDYELLSSFGFTLQKMHRPQLALDIYRRAQLLNSAAPELLNNLGIVLQDLGHLDEAIECYDKAIAARPGFELARWHRSLAYLLQHDFARGWEDYDLRLRSKDRPQRPDAYPLWTGGDPAPLGVLIYGEQGIGDEIMFASCLPQMIAQSRHCVIECSDKLLALFRRSFPDAVVRPVAPPQAPDSNINAQIAMGSLPKYLRRRAADFPRHPGYLEADPARISAWQTRLAALGGGAKIGIAWHGGTYKTRRPLRSIPLELWAPIMGVESAHFIDLQYTDCAPEIDAFEKKSGVRIHRWREAREDYEETAALVAALDLVISVCTAVIHLGGALGKPVWVLAPHSPEWRYGVRDETMPWYPSVRVFRQPVHAEWGQVIEDVAQSLRDWSGRTTVAADESLPRER